MQGCEPDQLGHDRRGPAPGQQAVVRGSARVMRGGDRLSTAAAALCCFDEAVGGISEQYYTPTRHPGVRGRQYNCLGGFTSTRANNKSLSPGNGKPNTKTIEICGERVQVRFCGGTALSAEQQRSVLAVLNSLCHSEHFAHTQVGGEYTQSGLTAHKWGGGGGARTVAVQAPSSAVPPHHQIPERRKGCPGLWCCGSQGCLGLSRGPGDSIGPRFGCAAGLCLVILGGGGSNWPPGILADPPTHPPTSENFSSGKK